MAAAAYHVNCRISAQQTQGSDGAAETGADPQIDFREAEHGCLAADTIIGRQTQLKATAQSHAVDRSNRWDGQIFQRIKNGVRACNPFKQFGFRQLEFVSELLDIGTDNVAAFATDTNDTGGITGRNGFDGGVQLR